MRNYKTIENYELMKEENKEIFKKYFLNNDKIDDTDIDDIVYCLAFWTYDDCELFEFLINAWYDDALEVFDVIEDHDYMIYDNCNNMGDVAYEVVHECYYDMFKNDSILTRYFDYDAFGRDLEIEGTFFEFNNGYVEIIK